MAAVRPAGCNWVDPGNKARNLNVCRSSRIRTNLLSPGTSSPASRRRVGGQRPGQVHRWGTSSARCPVAGRPLTCRCCGAHEAMRPGAHGAGGALICSFCPGQDFWEGLAAPKWSDRKAALTQLKELSSYPRLVGAPDNVGRRGESREGARSCDAAWVASTCVGRCQAAAPQGVCSRPSGRTAVDCSLARALWFSVRRSTATLGT